MPQTATNPETGERIALIDGQWVPITRTATNPETGERLGLAGNSWVPIGSAPTPTPVPAQEGEEPGFFTESGREFVRGTGRTVGAYGTVLEEAPEILGSMAGITGGPAMRDLTGLAARYIKSATGYKEAVAPTVQAIRETGRGISESVAPRQIGDIYQEYETDGLLGGLKSAAVTGAGSLPGLLASAATGLATRSPVAAGAVMTAAYAPQEYEGIRQTQAETGFGGVDEAVAGTAAIMAMDTLTGIGGKILSSVGRDVAEQEIKRGIISAATEVARTGRREAGTEAIQTLIGQVAGGEDPTTKESLKQIFESAVVGAVTGAAVGAPIEVGTRIARRRAERPTEEQIEVAGKDIDAEYSALLTQEVSLRMQENPDLDVDAALQEVLDTEGLPKRLYETAIANVESRANAALTPDAETVSGGMESSVPTSSGGPAVESEAPGQLELPFGRGVGTSSVDVSSNTGRGGVSQPALDTAPIYQATKMVDRVKAAEPVAINALETVTGGQTIEGLNGNTRRSVLATAKLTMANKARDGKQFDPITEVRAAFETKGIALPEVTAAPVDAAPDNQIKAIDEELALIAEQRAENAYEGEDPETKADYEERIAYLSTRREQLAAAPAAEEAAPEPATEQPAPEPIKLRGFKPAATGPARALSNKLTEAGTVNPTNENEIVVEGGGIQGAPTSDGSTFDLQSIRAVERGGGRKAMEKLTALADETGTAIRLSPEPFAAPAGKEMSPTELTEWYKGFGFQEQPEGTMIRTPAEMPSAAPEPVIEEAAPVEAAPVEPEPVTEEAAPVEEAPQAPEVQEEAVHSKLNENEKKRLAKHYGRKTYDAVAKSRFIQDFSNAVINGINSVAKAIRGIIRRIQKSVLAAAVVFSPAALTTDTPTNFAVNLEAAQPSAEFAVTNQKLIPAEILAVMSPAAQATYEALAPAAVASNRPFMVADKPNGRLLIFGKDGVFQQETVAIYGLQEGDVLPQARLDVRKKEELKLAGKPELRITPSGVFEFAVVDHPGYPGQKVLALTPPGKTSRVGIGERRGGGGVYVALHGNTVTSAQRAAALRSGDSSLSKQSMGCIVTSPKFFTENIVSNIDEFAEAVIAVVPDTQTNLDAVLAASTALTPVPGSPEVEPELLTEETAPALALGAMGAMGAMGVGQPGQRGAPRQVGRREEEAAEEEFGEQLKLSKAQIARAKERAGASGRKINKIQRTIAQTKRAQALAAGQIELGKAAKGEKANLDVLAAAFPNLPDKSQRAFLMLLPTTDVMRLAERANIKGLDAADKLVTDDMRRFDVRENERLAEELETLSRTFKKNPKGVEALMDVMVAAVGHDVDPSLATTPEEYAAKHDKKYQEYKGKSAKSRRLNEIKSVYAGIPKGDPRVADKEGITGWADLNPALKRAFVTMKKAHRRDLEDYFKGLKQRVKDQITDQKGQQAALAELDKQFKPVLDNAIYFPMMRHGRFFVRTSELVDGKQQPGFYMFETQGEMKKFSQEMAGVDGVEVQDFGNLEDYQKKTANRGADPLAKAINMLGQGTNATELKNELSRIYLSTLPGNSMKARFAKRKLRAGYSNDVLKSFMSARQSNKNARKSINFAHKLDTAISSAKDSLAGSPDQDRKRNIIREIELRTAAELNPSPGFGWDTIVRFGNKAAFYFYLATPKSALIQLTQMHVVSLPMLAGKYGHANSVAGLTKYGFTGLSQIAKNTLTMRSRDADGNVEWSWEQPKIIDSDFIQSLHKNDRNMQELLVEGWEEGRDVNLFMETFASDIVGAGETNAESLAKDSMTTTLRSFRNVAGFMAGSFHQMERVNREATYMAALELGYRKNIKDGMPHEEAKQKAIEDAKATTLEATFDFSEYNKPRIMTSSAGRMAFQFYMYPVSMFSLLGRSSFGAIKNYKDAAKNIADPELRQKLVAQANSDALVAAGMMFNIALYGGLTALPIYSVAKILTELFYAAFGDDDDFTDPETGAVGPGRDADYWFRNEWIPGFFGPGSSVAKALGLSDEQANMLALAVERGPIPALTNIDLTNSVALDALWFIPEKPRFSDDPRVGPMELFFSFAGGATGGVALDMFASGYQLSEGEILRAFETAPRFIGNTAKAMRYKQEGQNTMADLEVGLPAEMYTNSDMFFQMLGFASTAAAKELESGYGLKRVEQAAKDAKADIRKDVADIAADDARAGATSADFSSPEWQSVLERMNTHNRRYPDNILLVSELQESYLNKYFGIRESEAALGVEFEDLKSSRAAQREFERRQSRRGKE